MAAKSGCAQVSHKTLAFTTRLYTLVSDCWTLTKPEVNFMVALTTFTGFYLGHAHQPGRFPFPLLACTLVGTFLVASGTGTLNQYIERRFDAQMRRTANRPLARGRLKASTGLAFGFVLAALGGVFLAVTVNLLASALALFTLSSYLLIYTPLKRQSPACTFIGAIPGAMPPLIGWAAASGQLSSEVWFLCGILFLWQLPHFMAIAWMYRDDYQRAGYRVLPAADRRCVFVNWMTVLPLLVLIPLTLFPICSGHANAIYVLAALFAGIVFLYYGSALALQKSNRRARQLLLASIAYLPVVFTLLITK
jgi:protoheme IX farnesyltransferase